MTIGPDLADRRLLLKSWLATLHGPELTFLPTAEAVTLPLAALVRTAAAWHLAYALLSYGGALMIAKSGAGNAVTQAVAAGGTAAVAAVTLTLWWGGVALSSVLWWSGVRRARAQDRSAR